MLRFFRQAKRAMHKANEVAALVLIWLLAGCARSTVGPEPTGDDGSPPSTSESDGATEPPPRDERGRSVEDSGVPVLDPLDAGEPTLDAAPVADASDPVQVIAPVELASLPLPPPLVDAAGELLVSHSGRGCLGVAPSTPLEPGVPLGVDPCRGHPGQRFQVDAGVVRLAEAPQLCVHVGKSDAPLLASCDELGSPFRLATDGVLEQGTRALELAPDEQLLVTPTHRRGNQRWARHRVDLARVQAGKPASYPLPASDRAAYELELARDRLGSVQPPYPALAPRDVSRFPGLVPPEQPRVSRRVHFDRRFDSELAQLQLPWPNENWQATGLYAPADAPVVLEVRDSVDPRGLYVRINSHDDELTPESLNVKGKSFERMPRVYQVIRLSPGLNVVRSPYGGELSLESRRSVDERLPVDIHGAVELPRYLLGVTAPEEWERRRMLPVPWAELEGERVLLTVPSEQVRTLADPAALLARYDRIVALQAELLGLEPAALAGPHRRESGKVRIVSDLQITAGVGHAGYPIVVQHALALADPSTGGADWPSYRELGERHIVRCLYDQRFEPDATAALFASYVLERVQRVWPSELLQELEPSLAALEAGSLSYASANNWQRLLFLLQPVAAFPELGWEIHRRVHRKHRELEESERSAACNDRVLQLDLVYRLLSEAAGHDLHDHFERWGLAPSAAARARVAALGLSEPSVVVWRAKVATP